ncbi:MAG: hypothetical protein JW395_3450 [Nitrospira sp.]|nr:hypothetical protein [Nitrospira sp.]
MQSAAFEPFDRAQDLAGSGHIMTQDQVPTVPSRIAREIGVRMLGPRQQPAGVPARSPNGQIMAVQTAQRPDWHGKWLPTPARNARMARPAAAIIATISRNGARTLGSAETRRCAPDLCNRRTQYYQWLTPVTQFLNSEYTACRCQHGQPSPWRTQPSIGPDYREFGYTIGYSVTSPRPKSPARAKFR